MRLLTVLCVLLAACASDAPRTDFDDGAGSATVVVAADGFVELDGRRMPFEAAVLELRQRTRRMPAADLAQHFVVNICAGPAADAEQQQRIIAGVNLWLDQLQIMGVKQAAFR